MTLSSEQMAAAVEAMARAYRSTGISSDDVGLGAALRAALPLIERAVLERQADYYDLMAGEADVIAFAKDDDAHVIKWRAREATYRSVSCRLRALADEVAP